MLIITYKQEREGERMRAPPLILRLQEDRLGKKVQELLPLIHKQFTAYLSPFVSKHHLKLTLPSGQDIKLDLPLFMYIDFSQYTQEICCSVSSADSIGKLNQATTYLSNSVILRVVGGGTHTNNLNTTHSLRIIKKNQLQRVDYLVKEKDRVILNGKEVVLRVDEMELKGKSWRQLLTQHWDRFQSNGDCVYGNIIRSPDA